MELPGKIKVVGRLRVPKTPEECFWRGQRLQRQSDELNPYPRPRGFVFKAKTYHDYERWRRTQDNPRLW